MAQVHRARLVPELGGREVAVKVQRPSIEQKLLGDVANIKVGGWVGGWIGPPLPYFSGPVLSY